MDPSGTQEEIMMIPDYQACMLPLLKFVSDKNEHNMKEVIDHFNNLFDLTDEEKTRMLPSGLQSVIMNRAGWARTYLKKAGLIEQPKRAFFQITQRGLDLLNEGIKEINIKVLDRYEEFKAFRAKKIDQIEDDKNEIRSDIKTPEESIEIGFQRLNDSISEDIIIKVKECSPSFFEKLVVDLFIKMGYGGSLKDAGHVIGKSGDGGIDGIIKEDKLGLDVIYIQAKRWENVVGRPEIQKFAGALLGQKAKKGIFITTSWFTAEAKDFVKGLDNKIILIDGEMLAELMLEYNLGVSIYKSYNLKRVDSDYFIEENI